MLPTEAERRAVQGELDELTEALAKAQKRVTDLEQAGGWKDERAGGPEMPSSARLSSSDQKRTPLLTAHKTDYP